MLFSEVYCLRIYILVFLFWLWVTLFWTWYLLLFLKRIIFSKKFIWFEKETKFNYFISVGDVFQQAKFLDNFYFCLLPCHLIFIWGSPNMVNLKRKLKLMKDWWPDHFNQQTKILPQLRFLAIISLIVTSIK